MADVELSIRRPDDWHVHLRDGAALMHTVRDCARNFRRAIVMPNLRQPVVSTADAAAYRGRILAARPAGSDFEPLMTLYLTDKTAVDEIARAAASGFVPAAKLYPAGATTNSDSGVTHLDRIWGSLEAMAEHDLVLCVHGEVTDASVDIFDRERAFIDQQLIQIVERLPGLRVVFEHITTRDAVQFVTAASARVGATITAHHLLLDRNDMLVGGIRPHYYCLPILKRREHRDALLAAATGDDPRFFLGTDSAPHARHAKEAPCGCAGVYTARDALGFYAEAFEAAGRLDRLEAFASERGCDFYGLPRNTGTVALRRAPTEIPAELAFGDETVVPLRAGDQVLWSLAE
ncbi:MAG: dihydroorotase [Planctomycetota bacterium]